MRNVAPRLVRLVFVVVAAVVLASTGASVLAPGLRLNAYARVLHNEASATTPLSPRVTDCLMLQARLRHAQAPSTLEPGNRLDSLRQRCHLSAEACLDRDPAALALDDVENQLARQTR